VAEKQGGESTLTVLVATGANALIAVLKFVAGIFTGSAAMVAEAAHSVADTATEVLLLAALKRSARRADRVAADHRRPDGEERVLRGQRRGQFPGLQEVFLEPVPRTDATVRQRVLDRYGDIARQRLRDGP
jgi:hypothetical protein